MTLEEKPKINCKPCMGDKHDECFNPNTCRCADNNHGVVIPSLKDGTKVDDTKPISKEFVENWNDVNLSITIEEIIKKSFGFNDKCKNVLIHLIKEKRIITRSKLNQILFDELTRNSIEVKPKELAVACSSILGSNDVFTLIKNTAFELGELGISILLDKKQTTEVAYWILGRFSIKRIDLTGDLLFYNDQYYQNNAEILIRRIARECLVDSTNGDMNEIVKYVEDKSEIITIDDIANHAHLKCLLNGTFNIKTGKFAKEFSRDNITLQQIPHHYDESLKYEEIDKVVSQIISNKIDKQMYYDQISLCLHPYNGVYQQYGGVGIAGSGKSQLADLVLLALGKENCSHAPIHLIARDLTIQKECAYFMCNIDPDLSDESLEQLDTIKKWISQESMSGRGIYGHTTNYRPSGRLMFFANELFELPNNKDADAIYDRTYLARLDNRFRHTDSEKKNIMRSTATDEELDGFVTYLLKNATWIAEHESTHHALKPDITKGIWNIFGNRIKNFFEKYFEKGGTLKTAKQAIHDKWLHHALANGFGANDKKKFFELFDERVGTAPMYTRDGTEQFYAYAGFGLKSDEVIKKESQVKIKRMSYKCNLCSIIYKTNEPLERLRAFHREFYPDHLVIEDIDKK